MSPADAVALLVLSALWGGSFLFIRVAAPAFGPIVLIEARVVLAGLVLLGWALLAGRLRSPRGHWRAFLVIGIFNSALPFTLISAAELTLTASLAATLNATTPLFGAVVSALWLGEAVTVKKVLGLLLGFAGVVVLVGLGPLPLTAPVLLGVGASLVAALSYAASAVYTKGHTHGVPPLATSTYSQLGAALVLLPAVPFAVPAQPPTAAALWSLLALSLACTAFAYLLYFRLIANLGPTRAMLVTYLSPAFGILWGALFLAEPLSVATFAGFGLILASVGLVAGAPLGRKVAHLRASPSRERPSTEAVHRG